MDTEFNGFNGQLISMALVPMNNEEESFYSELVIKEPVDEWVHKNVVPKLNWAGVSYEVFQKQLEEFLMRHTEITIMVDWPDDIVYFCKALITGPGTAIRTPKLSIVIDRDLEYVSEIPHHALHDAVGLRQAFFTRSLKLK